MLSAKAPGKLILSGEHSVVYGAPAIAVAVTNSVKATFTPSNSSHLTITSSVLGHDDREISQLSELIEQLDHRFERFLLGELTVQNILTNPLDLLYYAVLQSGNLYSGEITITSDIPTGAGMGSSAAVIAAVLKLFEAALKREEDIDANDSFFQKVKYCERLQHGRGSAIDAAAVTYGGAVKVQADQVTPISLDLGEGWYHFHTGTPRCTTGETVAAVRHRFADRSDIWNQFAEVTQNFENSVGKPENMLSVIQSNHRLLQTIGVVPAKISTLIEQIEKRGGAAKICGAGAHQGHSAGQVLIYLPELNSDDLSSQLGITLTPLQQQLRGAYRA